MTSVAVAVAVYLTGCGTNAKPTIDQSSRVMTKTVSPYGTPWPRVKDSNDLDADPSTNDDSPIVSYGYAAKGPEFRAITALIKRYYRAAADDRGEEACSLLLHTYAELVPEEDGTIHDPPYLRGKTCPVVLDKLFKFHHRQIATQLPSMKVTLVRVRSSTALVVLSVTGTPVPQKITVGREGSTWKMTELLDSDMP